MKGIGVLALIGGILCLILGGIFSASSTKYNITTDVVSVLKNDDEHYGIFKINGVNYEHSISEDVYNNFIKNSKSTVDLEFSGQNFQKKTGEFYKKEDSQIYNNGEVVDALLIFGLLLIVLGLILSGAFLHLDVFSLIFLFD